MSFLSNLVAALAQNVQILEAELQTEGESTMPYLREPQLYNVMDDPTKLPSWKVFQAMESICADAKALQSAVTPNRSKLLSIAMSATKAASLQTAADLGVADAIEERGGSASLGILAKNLEVNENKLGRVIRNLAQESIFREIAPDTFANTRHSAGLFKNEGAAPFLSLCAVEGSLSSTALFAYMTNPRTRDDFVKAPFESTVSKSGEPFFQYIMQPEHADVLQKVVAGVTPWLNRTTRQALLEDFPWAEIGNLTVVDIGCGPGDSAVDVIKNNTKIKWVFQDLAPVIAGTEKDVRSQLQEITPAENLSFLVQDYFEPNLSTGDVFYLRGIIREYTDDENLTILKHVADAMRRTPGSRMIINEILCPTADIIPESIDSLQAPSKFIPHQQSAMTEVASLMTWNTYMMFGGYERSYRETQDLVVKAGFKILRFFKFRSFTTMIECILA